MSRFSRVSLFSGLNNLKDITLDPRYSAVCGYTDADLDAVFAPELPGLDRERNPRLVQRLQLARRGARLQTPSTSCCCSTAGTSRRGGSKTGTPTFLIDMLASRRIDSPKLDDMLSQRDLLSTFDVDDIATEALLFQTGYLTIRGEERRGGKEVLPARLPQPRSTAEPEREPAAPTCWGDHPAWRSTRPACTTCCWPTIFAGLESLFRALFASIPYEWHTKNEIARYEGYYASVFYSCFAALGLDVTVEDSSSHGRLDMAVRFQRQRLPVRAQGGREIGRGRHDPPRLHERARPPPKTHPRAGRWGS